MSEKTVSMFPVNGRVLVRPISATTDRKTAGGLFVPDSAGDQICHGKVMALDEVEWEGIDDGNGLQCLYLKGGGLPYKDDLFLVQKEAVLAFVSAESSEG